MATFKAKCPWCNQGFEAEEEWVGKTGECPKCGKKLTIKVPVSASIKYNLNIQAAELSDISSTHEDRNTPFEDDLGQQEEKSCPFCGEPIKRNAVKCKHCQSSLSPSLQGVPKKSHFKVILAVLIILVIAGGAAVIFGLKVVGDYRAQVRKATKDLFYAAQYDDLQLALAAFDKGADVNMKDRNGMTPIFNAVANGSFKMAELLIQRGADVNVRDGQNMPVTVYAALRGDIAMLNYLVSKGANPMLDEATINKLKGF